jgi:uncharacterized membrane protein YedE/YeeE
MGDPWPWCSAVLPGKLDYFRYDWKRTGLWNLVFVAGILVGGFLVGFGPAVAGGCTSGHAISGLGDLQLYSLIAGVGFFMHEVIASAVVVAAASLATIKKLELKTVSGDPITLPPKTLGLGVRYAVDGTIFGLGWALTGACRGPLFALVGNGVTVMIAAIGSALAGTWLYGFLRWRLPH